MTQSSFFNRGFWLASIFVLLSLSVPAIADSLGAIPPAGDERARATFSEFTVMWMAKLKAIELQKREDFAAQPQTSAGLVVYRDFGEEVSTELHPTGHPAAPYIGILRYREKVHSCSGTTTTGCSVASAVPVTEIFRFQDGRWVY